MSSAPAPTTVQFEQLPDEDFYPNNEDADEFMASFAQTTQDLSSDEDRPTDPDHGQLAGLYCKYPTTNSQ